MQKTGAPLAISASDCAKPSFQQLTWAATPSSIHPNPNPNGQLALQNCDSEEMLLLSPVPHRMKSLITGKTGVIDMTKCLFSQLPCHNFAEFRQRCSQLVSARIEIEAHVAFSRMQCALFVEIRLVTNARGRGGRAVKHLQLREQRRRVVGRTLTINDEPVTVAGVQPASFDLASVFAPGSHFDLYFPFPLSNETNRWGNTMAMVSLLSGNGKYRSKWLPGAK